MPFDWLKSLRPDHPRRCRSFHLATPTPLEPRTLLSAVPVGPEFQVNTYTSGSQWNPSIAMDADGDYVITWESETSGSGWDIFAHRYNAAGVPQGAEFQVNTYTSGPQRFPFIGMRANGDFVITWNSQGQDGSGWDVYAQQFNSEGVAQGSEFRVNTYTTGEQRFPGLSLDADGNFVITWESSGQDGSDRGIYAQRYNALGVAQGTEFLVNSWTTGDQRYPSIGMDADGDFVITWQSDGQDGSGDGIFAQRYNSLGVPQGPEFQVNSYTSGSQGPSLIAMNAHGEFVISWDSYGQDGSGWGIYAQRYNSAGVAQGSEFQVNSYTSGSQEIPSIGMDEEGDFVITWNSYGQDGSDFGIFAQRYNSLGVPEGPEFQANSWTTDWQNFHCIAMDADGDFVITWESGAPLGGEQDGSYEGIYAQRYLASHPDNLAVWRSSRFYLDSNHSNTWNGSTDDTLSTFGATTDKPLVGDWNGDGYTDIGIWRNGTFYIDANGNGIWDGTTVDKTFKFGLATDTPLVGDWNKDGKDDIGVWRAGKFYLDLDGNHAWNSGVDAYFSFGSATDTPIIGDWNADGTDDIGIWRAGKFYLDLNANRTWNSGIDGIFTFGLNTDTPLIGDWNGDGIDDIGVWRAGKFYRDADGSRSWNSSTDTVTTFGSSTDTPLIGYWRPKSIPGTPPAPALLPDSLPTIDFQLTFTSPTSQPNEQTLASLLAPPTKKRDH